MNTKPICVVEFHRDDIGDVRFEAFHNSLSNDYMYWFKPQVSMYVAESLSEIKTFVKNIETKHNVKAVWEKILK